MLLPSESKPTPYTRNERMEKDFNRHHGAIERTYGPGDKVFIMNYTTAKRSWLPGVIIERCGNVLYKVQTGNNVQRRHTNQIRPRHTDEHSSPILNSPLPFDMLTETFDVTVPVITPAPVQPIPPSPEPQTPRRYPSRQHRQPTGG